ncbi:hypothetical protein LOK49_LG03G00501 [Camellia lanceoleosa]|uniref:Uncharacterized protein n=1 Tax=Camellia lanceoleosa TaxID=1840588 RepID=A0ACC0I9M8_9ERIC|nr:hypothetical protein LOK49_LG03G00501 [Camellia lanceoleosa]
MQKFSGKRSELEMIKLLLAKSPMLETMLIEPNSEAIASKGMRILKELTRFRHLSPQVHTDDTADDVIDNPVLKLLEKQDWSDAYVDEETNAVDPVLELLEMQQWLDVSLNQLQTVDFWNLSGTSSELEFVKLLLAISPVLR